MFKNLTVFSYERTIKEAIGFYLAYLFFSMILGIITAGTLGIFINSSNSFNFGLKVGNFVAVIFSSAISFLIVKEKN